jgi:hypothetical protein
MQITRYDADERPVVTERPANDDPNCPLCGSPWGPWLPGPPENYDDDEDGEG